MTDIVTFFIVQLNTTKTFHTGVEDGGYSTRQCLLSCLLMLIGQT